MEQIMHLFKKEFRAYVGSPIAYIVISIFLVVSGWFFFSTFFLYGQAELRNFFNLLPYTCSFIIPAITMRLFAEEFNTGSYELLVTLPVTRRDIVLGKFLAATAFSGVMLLPTLFYAASVSLLGDLDWGPVLGGYIGALLLCAAYSAVGVLASALTKNQIVAFITAMTACIALTLLDKLLVFAPERFVGLFQYLGADAHFQSIARGILDTRDVLYFLSVCFVALSGTMIAIEERS
jgi:ABC-2 type transport system permease protein